MTSHDAASVTGVDDAAVDHGQSIKQVYVYEAPVRLWHWVNAACIVVLAVTGYLIASPLPSMPGQASAHFTMGYIRFAHFTAAYIFTVGLLARIYWAFVGNGHSRELFTLPIFSAAYWREVKVMLRWYALIGDPPHRYVGHNPVARAAMFFGFFLTGLFMVVTGWAMYGEGDQAGSWSHTLFTNWVVPLFGQSQEVHTLHHLGMWIIISFVIVHIYAAVREEIMGRQSMVSTMISGYRMFKR